jgi:hypothetical protein
MFNMLLIIPVNSMLFFTEMLEGIQLRTYFKLKTF